MRGRKQYWRRWAVLMEFGLCMIDMNERRKMRSNWSNSFCSLSVFNERRTNPVECTSSSLISSMDSSDSLYRIPNVMFCSLRSYLLSISWIVCRELQLFISCLILIHLLLHNDLDRNPLSCPFVHRILPSTVCLRHSCISIPVWWPGHSCVVIPASLLFSCMSYCMLSASPSYLLLDPHPAVDIREHLVHRQSGDGVRYATASTWAKTPLRLWTQWVRWC